MCIAIWILYAWASLYHKQCTKDNLAFVELKRLILSRISKREKKTFLNERILETQRIGFEDVMEKYSLGQKNVARATIRVNNTIFMKPWENLISHRTGEAKRQTTSTKWIALLYILRPSLPGHKPRSSCFLSILAKLVLFLR